MNSRKVSFIKISLPIVVLTILVFGIMPVRADVYETFSNNNLDNWHLSANEYTYELVEDPVKHQGSPSWSVNDGMLYSDPNVGYDSLTEEIYACRLTDFTIGSLQFDVLANGGFALYLGKNFDIDQNLHYSEIQYTGYYFLFLPQVTKTSINIYYPSETREFGQLGIIGSHLIDGTRDLLTTFTFQFTDNKLMLHQSSSESDLEMDITSPLQADIENQRFDTVCLVSDYHGGDKWDNVFIRKSSQTLMSQIKEIGVFSLGAVLVITAAVAGYKLKASKKNKVARLQEKYGSIRIVQRGIDLEAMAHDVEITDAALLTLLTNKPDDDPRYLSELKNSIPAEMRNFKYLMHPTRMMILKILYGEFRMTTATLIEVIDISAADFANHQKSLEKNGYITVKREFTRSGTFHKMMYLTKKGNNEYQALVDVLHDFLEENTPYLYILKVKEIKDQENELYPNESDN